MPLEKERAVSGSLLSFTKFYILDGAFSVAEVNVKQTVETDSDGHIGSRARQRVGVSEDMLLSQETLQPPKGVWHGVFLHQLRLCLSGIIFVAHIPKSYVLIFCLR
jgi:hypothetical protein